MKRIPKEAREQIDATIKLLDDLTKKMTRYFEGRKGWYQSDEGQEYEQWIDSFSDAQVALECLDDTIFEDEDDHPTRRGYDSDAAKSQKARKPGRKGTKPGGASTLSNRMLGGKSPSTILRSVAR